MNEIFTMLIRARNKVKARNIREGIFMGAYIAVIHQFFRGKLLIVEGHGL